MAIDTKTLTKLTKIKNLYSQIYEIYQEFDDETKKQFQEFDNERYSLESGLCFGLVATTKLVNMYSKNTKSLLQTFKEYCKDRAYIASLNYDKTNEDKYIVYDAIWNQDKDDCDMYDRAAEFLIDEEPQLFINCETIDDCIKVVKKEYEEACFNDYLLDEERSNLSFGEADLRGITLIEVGSIGRWNGTSYGLNIMEVDNIGKLLSSNCHQWKCYVDKKTGEFCKLELHHDGRNFYKYRELTCDKEKFEELLEKMKPGEMDTLVEKYTKSIGRRVADIYGWNLENNLANKIKQMETIKQEDHTNEIKNYSNPIR